MGAQGVQRRNHGQILQRLAQKSCSQSTGLTTGGTDAIEETTKDTAKATASATHPKGRQVLLLLHTRHTRETALLDLISTNEPLRLRGKPLEGTRLEFLEGTRLDFRRQSLRFRISSMTLALMRFGTIHLQFEFPQVSFLLL